MKKNIQKSIVAGTATVFGGIALAGAVAPANAAPSVNWDAVAECESGGDWGISTGNGFSGGLQFTPQTWAGHGGQGDPANASKSEQIAVAENVMETQGIGAWPTCGPLGLGGTTPSTPEPAPAETEVSTQSVEPAAEAPAPAAEPAPVEAPAEQAPAEAPAPVEAPAEQAPAPAEAPAAEQAPVVEYTAPAAPVAPQAEVSGTYEVQAGDTLGSIAAELGVDWEDLYAANSENVADANLIFVGQALNVPA